MKNKKDDKGYLVYALRLKATGEPFYFGKGRPKRPKEHYYLSSLRKKSPKNDVINSCDTYYTIERDGLTNEEANAYEKELIALWGFENLTNQTRGGSGIDGCIPSPETRAKQSESKWGDKNPMFGNTGDKNHLYGKTGNKSNRYDATIHTFEHKDGRVETCTQYELRMKCNLRQSNISKVVNGKRKSTGGWSLPVRYK